MAAILSRLPIRAFVFRRLIVEFAPFFKALKMS
jgi:hypothetical protein